MNKRENTFFDSALPNNATFSGIRQVSIGSIALLQLLNNPFANVMLNGGDLPINDVLSMLQFVYLHTQPQDTVTKEVLQSKVNPDAFNEKVLNFGVTINMDEIVNYIHDIMRDRDNINNAKTKPIDNDKGTQSKNEHSQV